MGRLTYAGATLIALAGPGAAEDAVPAIVTAPTETCVHAGVAAEQRLAGLQGWEQLEGPAAEKVISTYSRVIANVLVIEGQKTKAEISEQTRMMAEHNVKQLSNPLEGPYGAFRVFSGTEKTYFLFENSPPHAAYESIQCSVLQIAPSENTLNQLKQYFALFPANKGPMGIRWHGQTKIDEPMQKTIYHRSLTVVTLEQDVKNLVLTFSMNVEKK